MNNQQYIEEIRKACIKTNPEIMELKFGCAWKDNQADWVYIEGFSVTTSQKGGWTSVPPDQEQILGRPITLADVLLAIWSKDKNGARTLRQHTGIIADGGYKETILERFILSQWNLKQNLENQSEETIEWLYKLIKE